MALPQSNYTQVPNIVIDNLLNMKESEIRLIMVIIRQTIGFHHQKRRLSVTYLEKMTGMKRAAVVRACQSLENRGWIDRHMLGKSNRHGMEFSLKLEPNEDELVSLGDQNADDIGIFRRPILVSLGDQKTDELVSLGDHYKRKNIERKKLNTGDPPLPPQGEKSGGENLNRGKKPPKAKQADNDLDGLKSEPEEIPTPLPPAPLPQQPEVNPASAYAHPANKTNERFMAKGNDKPWRLSSRRNDFDPQFVEWIQRHLNTTPHYQKKPNGCSLYHAKSYIQEGDVDETKLSKLEAEWHEYQQSLKPKSQATPHHSDAPAFMDYQQQAQQLGHVVEYRGISEGSIRFSLDGDGKWNTFDPKVALIQIRSWQITSKGRAS